MYQKITYGLNINGDGDYCELKEPTYSSDWAKLEMKNDLVSVKRSPNDMIMTPKISIKELKNQIKTECGDYHLSLTNHIDRPEEISSLIQPREVILKINFTNTESNISSTEYIVFVIANGC